MPPVDGDDRIVLTYAALPDPDPAAPAVPLIDVGVLSSGDPLRPGPDGLHGHHVAAHAVRHLAQLAASDPGIRGAAAAAPALWRALCVVAADIPTGTHADLRRTPRGPPNACPTSRGSVSDACARPRVRRTRVQAPGSPATIGPAPGSPGREGGHDGDR